MTNKEGTGDVLGRIELKDIGTMIIRDDGHADPDVSVQFESPDGEETYFSSWLSMTREQMADSEFSELLDDAAAEPSTGGESGDLTNFDLTGPFVCQDCYRTWPGEYKERGDLCPDCAN